MVPAYRKYLKNQSLPGMAEIETDQMKGLPIPPIQKPCPKDAELVDLISPEQFSLGNMSLIEAIRNRRSRRNFTQESLTLEELSFLLWATQGVEQLIHNGLVTIRTVPSGGAMHPFETYLLINRVNGVSPGLYRYLALNHKLLKLPSERADLPSRISEAANGQNFIGESAVVFVWTVRPYRTEYRYGEDSLKDILISVGHICQNLYLACESIGVGTNAIIAYNQKLLDSFVGVDGEDEIALYLAPVGRVK
ncbi:MAG: SagB/ThcOx family dehydrogenase [Candidatus Bathyarchaeota archaeon]|nr:SagB/ThcOx family dehydrogenase [Candidatus Bathyarchaeota archaeon]